MSEPNRVPSITNNEKSACKKLKQDKEETHIAGFVI